MLISLVNLLQLLSLSNCEIALLTEVDLVPYLLFHRLQIFHLDVSTISCYGIANKNTIRLKKIVKLFNKFTCI